MNLPTLVLVYGVFQTRKIQRKKDWQCGKAFKAAYIKNLSPEATQPKVLKLYLHSTIISVLMPKLYTLH